MTATITGARPRAGARPTASRVHASRAVRPARRRSLFSLILLGVILAAAFSGHPGSDVGLAAQSLRADPGRDLAVLANPSGSYTLFVADGKAGTIRYKEVEAGKDVEGWDLKDFEPFEIKGGNVPRQPVALAVNGTSLYVVDYEEEALYAVDLATRASRLLLRKPALENPLSVAVAGGGLLAIGQDDESVLLYDPATPDTPPRALPDKIDNPVRLQFVPSPSQKTPSLLVLDSDNEGQLTLYQPSDRDPGAYTPKLIQIPANVSSRLEQRADTSLDLAFLDGNYYLTEGRNWAVFSEMGLTSSRWVLFPGMYKVTPERLRAAGNGLFLYDSKQNQVMRLSLKLMTVRLEVKASEANALLTELYQVLYDEKKGSLPEREYVVGSGNRKLEELLKAEQVLAPGNYSPMFSPVEGGGTPAGAYTGNLEYLLCILNRRLNEWKCPDNRADAAGLERMKRSYGRGQVLVIPGLGVEQALYEGAVPLRGKSVEEAIKERLMAENPHEKFTTEYLMRIDPAYYRTVDYELTRRGYIMPSSFVSTPALTPGALLKIAHGREQVAAEPGCQPNWPEVARETRSEPVEELTEKLGSYAPALDYLPRVATSLSDQSVLAEWKKLGIEKLEVVFEKPVEERGSRPALLTGAPPPCWAPLADKNAYVVGDVIRVAGARFRLLKKDGEVAQVRGEDLSRWGVDAVTDEAGEWSFKVVKPYVLGYRALPWDGQPLFTEKQPNRRGQNLVEPQLRFASDPRAVKPGATQDIWAKTDGKFFLPGFRWEIKLLTDSATLGEDSVIRKWAARYPEKVYVWPASGKSGGDTRPDTLVAAEQDEPRPQETLAQVAANRELLRKSIKFPDAVKTSDIIIGLMERSGSVERLNSDFAWKEIKVDCPPEGPCPWEFVWLVPSEDKSAPPERLRHPLSAGQRVVRPRGQIEPQAQRYWAANHGTHVAGLLASNYGDAPGLLPDAKICWLELGSPPVPLPDQITQQNSNALRVINVSQEFLDNSYDWLKDQLGIEGAALNSKLFVVAAGNDGLDLNRDTKVRAPVAWLHQFNNILSVSATDMEHKLLFKGDGSYRVNYGVKYVDLLAPGHEIYSSTEMSAYASTSGTSQAAPLVTATAALLAKSVGGSFDPSLIKGRLIYTADWEGSTLQERENWDPNHSYRDKVWGGSLNAGRAVFGHDHDIFLYEFGQTTRHRAIHDIPDQAKLIIKNWKTTEAVVVRQPARAGERSEVALTEADSRIDFGQVLRMIRLRNGLYRIIYKAKTDPWNLKIIMNASVEGTFKYRNYEDVDNNRLVERPILQQWETIRLDTVIDYVGSFGKMGSKIAFR